MSAPPFRVSTLRTPATPRFRTLLCKPLRHTSMPCSRRVFSKNHFRSFLLVIARHIITIITPPLQPVNTFTSLSPSIHKYSPLSGSSASWPPHHTTERGLLGKAHKRISPLDPLRPFMMMASLFFFQINQFFAVINGSGTSDRSATSRLMRL